MTKKRIVHYLVMMSGLLMVGRAAAQQDARPNMVWIFSDDHSYQTIGAYGGRMQALDPTPNIDRLARDGIRFDRCYVGNSICAPARGTLLTGLHSHLHGKINNVVPFNHDQPQFQKILQQHGYQTVMIGKIHLDGQMQGFDYWDVLPGQGEYDNPHFITAQGEYETEGYVTDIITDKAIDWLENRRDADRPFMLMIHQKAPHREWTPAERHMAKYEDVDIPMPDNFFDDYGTRTTAAHRQKMTIVNDMKMQRDLKIGPFYAKPGSRFIARNAWFAEHQPEGLDLAHWKYQTYLKDYLRCIWAVDEGVGRVMDTLKAQGLDENTIVMYSSDQGFYMGEHGWFDKRFMYEESFRTPLIAYWPGHIQPGSVNTDLVQNIDFAETFLDLAGVAIPDFMQGRSLVPLLKGATPSDWRTSLYYHYYEYPGAHRVRRHEGVFDGRHKLIRFYGRDVPNGEEWELYDLANDPSEMNNIFGDPTQASPIAELKRELARLREVYRVPDEPVLVERPPKMPPAQTVPKVKKTKAEKKAEKARREETDDE